MLQYSCYIKVRKSKTVEGKSKGSHFLFFCYALLCFYITFTNTKKCLHASYLLSSYPIPCIQHWLLQNVPEETPSQFTYQRGLGYYIMRYISCRWLKDGGLYFFRTIFICFRSYCCSCGYSCYAYKWWIPHTLFMVA